MKVADIIALFQRYDPEDYVIFEHYDNLDAEELVGRGLPIALWEKVAKRYQGGDADLEAVADALRFYLNEVEDEEFGN